MWIFKSQSLWWTINENTTFLTTKTFLGYFGNFSKNQNDNTTVPNYSLRSSEIFPFLTYCPQYFDLSKPVNSLVKPVWTGQVFVDSIWETYRFHWNGGSIFFFPQVKNPWALCFLSFSLVFPREIENWYFTWNITHFFFSLGMKIFLP